MDDTERYDYVFNYGALEQAVQMFLRGTKTRDELAQALRETQANLEEGRRALREEKVTP